MTSLVREKGQPDEIPEGAAPKSNSNDEEHPQSLHPKGKVLEIAVKKSKKHLCAIGDH